MIDGLNLSLFFVQLVQAVIEYIEYGEGERAKLKAQVRRLADENGWLRQELQKCQQSLQESELELSKVQEEKDQLSYLVNLPQVNVCIYIYLSKFFLNINE